MRVFIFGIGGTGARVLRSLNFLLASGVKLPDKVEKIIPIIIDVDANNADTLRTIQSIEAYSEIRKMAYGESSKENGFFSNRFVTLGAERVEVREDQRIKESFQLNFQGIDDSFYDYLGGGTLSMSDQHLLELLFDNVLDPNDPRKELHLRLSHGFKGNPNMGSIIFNDLVNTSEYQYFEKSFRRDDRIFIISSIFGGTGSAGFPQLVRNLRNGSNDLLKEAPIGAVVVKPYFTVSPNPLSAINSDVFNGKTKAALSYYEHELDGKVNSIYYVGDEPGDPYGNYEGGRMQKNPAHIVELIAAMAATEFIGYEASSFRLDHTDYFEFGAIEGPMNMDISHFYDDVQREYMSPLTQFSIAGKLLLNHFPNNEKHLFYAKLELNPRDAFFSKIRNFFEKHYFPWLIELGENHGRKFTPFDLSPQEAQFAFDDLVRHAQVRVKGLFGGRKPGITTDYINKLLAEREGELTKEGVSSKDKRLLMTLARTAQQIFDQKISPIFSNRS